MKTWGQTEHEKQQYIMNIDGKEVWVRKDLIYWLRLAAIAFVLRVVFETVTDIRWILTHLQ